MLELLFSFNLDLPPAGCDPTLIARPGHGAKPCTYHHLGSPYCLGAVRRRWDAASIKPIHRCDERCAVVSEVDAGNDDNVGTHAVQAVPRPAPVASVMLVSGEISAGGTTPPMAKAFVAVILRFSDTRRRSRQGCW